MTNLERAKQLLEKWKFSEDFTKSSSEEQEIKLKTAILLEPQEVWLNPISNAPVAQSEERSPD